MEATRRAAAGDEDGSPGVPPRVDEVLAAVAGAASADVGAVGHALWADVPGQDRPCVVRHGEGATDEAVGAPGGRLVADVASPARWYGRLVVAVAHEQPASPAHQRVVAAHGAFAAALLDAVADLAASGGVDAAGLLALAADLAGAGTEADVASAVAAALPAATGADRAAVYLSDAGAELLVLAAASGPGQLRVAPLRPGDAPDLARLLARPGPHLLVEGGDTVPPARLAGPGARWAAVAPLAADGRFLGAVVAGSSSGGAHGPHGAPDALLVVARVAAAALRRLRLVDEARGRTASDPATGLPAAGAFHAAGEAALATMAERGARPAVIVLRLVPAGGPAAPGGTAHSASPAGVPERTLRAAAEHLVHSVRRGDVVARLGAHALGVLLADVASAADATGKADRLAAELGRLLPGADATVAVACAPGNGTTIDALLAAAGA